MVFTDGINILDLIGAEIEVNDVRCYSKAAETGIEASVGKLATDGFDDNFEFVLAVDQASVPLEDNTVRDDANYIPPQPQENLSASQELFGVDNILDDNSYVQTTVDQDAPLEDSSLRDVPNYMPLETEQNSSESSGEEENEEALLNNLPTSSNQENPAWRKRNRKAEIRLNGKKIKLKSCECLDKST